MYTTTCNNSIMKDKFLSLVALFLITYSYSQKEIEFQNPYKFSDDIGQITSSNGQLAAFFYSAIGDYDTSLKVWDEIVGVSNPAKDSVLQFTSKNQYKLTNAIPIIVEKAKKTEYVILNEAHHRPDHRVFALKVLKELYNLGYRNLGVETLTGKGKYYDDSLNLRKYPIVTSGSYSREPQFGELIREALKLGYFVFPYDELSVTGKDREIAQASNIIKNRKQGKTFVYCGFQHALEEGNEMWDKAMAENLKQLTGENPLSINQVTFSQKSSLNFEHPIYKDFEIIESKSKVLIDENDETLRLKENSGYYDISVLQPRSELICGRPDWIFNSCKKPVKISLKWTSISSPYMILAYYESEDYNEAVPVDIIEVKKTYANNKVYMALKPGNYNIIFSGKNGNAELKELVVE